MRYNTGPAFVHPITQRVIENGQWYDGNAHVEAENSELIAVSDVTTEDAQPQETAAQRKAREKAEAKAAAGADKSEVNGDADVSE